MRPARVLSWSILVTIAACSASGGGTAATEVAPDAASPRDASAGTTPDAGGTPPPDASAPPDASTPSDGGEGTIPAIASCAAPTGDACNLPAPVQGLFASYRKDSYLPESQYGENGALPTSGGRLHIAGTAEVSGNVTRVTIDGKTLESLVDSADIEWWHVWPRKVTAGGPLWVAFHSRKASWDTAASATLRVETDAGTAVVGTFAVAKTPAPLGYVTTTEDRKSLLVHLRNESAQSQTIARVLVNGRDVGAVACLPKKTLAPGEPALITVPRCTVETPGAPFTVAVEYAGAPAAVGVGRIVKPFFPVESWVTSSDCPFPGGNAANWQKHARAGIDTIFLYWGSEQCATSTANAINVTAPASNGAFHVLLADDFAHRPGAETLITNTDGVAAFMTGDESDGTVLDGNGKPNPDKKAAEARKLWGMYPDVPVYNGAKTNKNVGTFAGMADVQGIDFYVAACAPHITQWGTHPPLRGAYDYLRNTRNNHMRGCPGAC
jgi:hypothetical protein